MAINAPKPNTQALSWFYSEYKKGSLRMKPKYQRNPIWSIGQKCFLIDSLISGCPIPQVFINIIDEGSGRDRRAYYEVVDGQQRLRAILDFMLEDYALIATTAKSYPVSEKYKPHIGKKYSELPNDLQDMIWNYPIAVQEIRGWSDKEIRSLFRRLNYVVEKLNKQEMRHSQYFGEFVDAVETLADEDFWDDISLFSRRDSQRMKDIEFISELFILLIDGPQDQQKTIDKFYANYDVEFKKKKAYMQRFRRVLKSLKTISKTIEETRFKKKADFYGIFGAVAQTLGKKRVPLDLTPLRGQLEKLHKALEQPSKIENSIYQTYHSTVIEGPNKHSKRNKRIEILRKIIKNRL